MCRRFLTLEVPACGSSLMAEHRTIGRRVTMTTASTIRIPFELASDIQVRDEWTAYGATRASRCERRWPAK